MRGNGFQQQSSEAERAMTFFDDDVEDGGFVNEVGEDTCECDEPAGFRFTEREDEIGMFDHAPHIREFPAAAPRFPLKHAPELLDVAAVEAADELELGFAGRNHEAPGERN